MEKARKISVLIVLASFLAILGIAIYVSRLHYENSDPLLQRIFQSTSAVKSYREQVQTSLIENDRSVDVAGIYLLDATSSAYSSFSTTTLQLTSGKASDTFAVANISLGADVYTRVVNYGTLRLSVPGDRSWHHFHADAIPPEYVDIATAGPLLDNIALFHKNGVYLQLEKRMGLEMIGGKILSHYQFRLSDAGIAIDTGALAPIVHRIGPSGVIDVWIDVASSSIRMIRFHNGPYTSTTTIDRINERFDIAAPRLDSGTL